jgi:hypothetical protein
MWRIGWLENEPMDFSMRQNRIRSLEPNGLSWLVGLADPRLSAAVVSGLSVGLWLILMVLTARGQPWKSYLETAMF